MRIHVLYVHTFYPHITEDYPMECRTEHTTLLLVVFALYVGIIYILQHQIMGSNMCSLEEFLHIKGK